MNMSSLLYGCGPKVFAMMITETLKGLDHYFTCLDDIIIYSKSEKERLNHIQVLQVLDHLCKAHIKFKIY